MDFNTTSGQISSTTASSNCAAVASSNVDTGRLIGTNWFIKKQEARRPTKIGPTYAEETSSGHKDPEDDQAFI